MFSERTLVSCFDCNTTNCFAKSKRIPLFDRKRIVERNRKTRYHFFYGVISVSLGCTTKFSSTYARFSDVQKLRLVTNKLSVISVKLTNEQRIFFSRWIAVCVYRMREYQKATNDVLSRQKILTVAKARGYFRVYGRWMRYSELTNRIRMALERTNFVEQKTLDERKEKESRK